MTQPDLLYHHYTFGLSVDPHIKDKCREDTRTCGRVRSVRHVGRGPPRTTFSLSLFIIFFFFLHLHQSRASDRTYEGENEECGYIDGEIGVQNGHARSLTRHVRGRLGGQIW